MADSFGALELPTPAPAARNDLPGQLTATEASLTDPCLDTLLSFVQAVLRAQLNIAWGARALSELGDIAGFLSTNNPHKSEFNDNQLPGLFLFRDAVDDPWLVGADFPATSETLKLLWVFPPDTQWKERLRNSIWNGLTKVLVQALEQGRHPSWVIASDQADPNAVKLAVATSTSAQTYSGAALDGAIGGGNATTPRPLTVTSSSAVGTFNVTDPIIVIGTLFTGETGFTDTISLTSANGGETRSTTWNFASVQSIATPGQLLTTGQFQFGYGASSEAAHGSPIRRYAAIKQLRCSGARRVQLAIDARGQMVRYDAIEFDLKIQEHFRTDYDAMDGLDDAADGVGLYTSFLHEDGSTYSEAAYE